MKDLCLLFGWLLRLREVVVASFDEDVVPLDELADVASMYAIGIILRHHLGKPCTLIVGRILGGDRGNRAAGKSLGLGKYRIEGHFAIDSIHCDIAKRENAITLKGWTTTSVDQRFTDQHILAAADESVKSGLAGNRKDSFNHIIII